jgi:PAS domain S-box-containing protein
MPANLNGSVLDVSIRQKAILDAIPDILVEVDNHKIYTWANRIGLEFFGKDMIGRDASYYFEGNQDVYEKVEPIFKGSSDTIYLESWQRRFDGQKRLLAWWCHVLKDYQGRVIGAISTARDITEQKQASESLLKSQLILQNIIDLLPVRIFWKDMDLNILGCNKAFAEDAGKKSPEEIIGSSDYQMSWKDQADLYRADDMNVIKTGKAKLNYTEPQTTPAGDKIWLNTNKVPLVENNGNIIGVVGTYLDITTQKKSEEMLKKSEDRLKKAQAVAHVGNWELDLNTKVIWASEEAFRIYGLERKSPELPLIQIQKMVLEEYRPILDQALTNLVNEAEEYNEEFQLKRANDKMIRYIHSKAELFKNDEGIPIKVLGTIQDITDRKAVENELRRKNEELEKINKIMVNRELRMVELKKQIKILEDKLSK